MSHRIRFVSRLLAAAAAALLVASCRPGTDSEQAQQARLEAERYLERNAGQPGVVTTASGLQYQVLQEGSGPSPTAVDTVLVNYSGAFVNGQMFDDGQSISFPLSGVIPGWTEGLQLMKEGARYRFFVPPALAYGEAGAGSVIPPNAALVFEVELLKVNPDVAPEAAPAESTQ